MKAIYGILNCPFSIEYLVQVQLFHSSTPGKCHNEANLWMKGLMIAIVSGLETLVIQ